MILIVIQMLHKINWHTTRIILIVQKNLCTIHSYHAINFNEKFLFFFAPIFPINRKAAISHIFSLELPKFKCNNGSKQVQILINITVEMRIIKPFFI